MTEENYKKYIGCMLNLILFPDDWYPGVPPNLVPISNHLLSENINYVDYSFKKNNMHHYLVSDNFPNSDPCNQNPSGGRHYIEIFDHKIISLLETMKR